MPEGPQCRQGEPICPVPKDSEKNRALCQAWGCGNSRMGKCPPLPQVGNLPSLVASIFSASPGSSWRNRLVIRVFIFRLFPTSGKQNVETGEIQGCWKRLLSNRPGNSAFKPLGPRSQEKKVGRGQPSPQDTEKAGFSACLQF